MNMAFQIPEGNFCGHERQSVWRQEPDPELTEVGPGTPCGEYMRRFWMPVAMTNQVGDLPAALCVITSKVQSFLDTGIRIAKQDAVCLKIQLR